MNLRPVDRVEILSLQDNYVDLVAQDNSSVVMRAVPLKGLEVKNSILAEHGFSALVKVTADQFAKSLLFDFGFSEHGAAYNAAALNADLTQVQVMALSHGHPDHTGGMEQLMEKIGKKDVPLYLHPGAFKAPRYLKITEELKIIFPSFSQEKAAAAGAAVITSETPQTLLSETALFLGGIPRKTDFEKGAPNLCCQENGVEKQDPIEDDTALVFHVAGKGLVVVSGCAHAGIVNTVTHAINVTGVDKVHAIMGGFHLSGMDFDSVIQPTVAAIKAFEPDYVIPTHCTGRAAVNHFEREMPAQFLLNMAGTNLTFSA